MDIFCKDLRDQAMKIINYEKRKEIILTNEEKESYENQKVCYICEKELCTDKNNDKEFKLYRKIRDHCQYTGKYRGAAHSICNLRYKIPKEIPVIFHNGSTYDYHFIIKQLAKEFKGNFECLGENTEKYITLSVPIKKEHDNGKTVIYKLKFVDSYRFMSSSLSILVDNLSEINKKPTDEFIDNFRSMLDLLLCHIGDLSEINKKIEKSENKCTDEFLDSFRSMQTSVSSLVDGLSVINNKELELENKCIDNIRSMLASLSCLLDDLSEINKKYR